MKTSAQESLKTSQNILSSVKEKIVTGDADVIIFGVDNSNASVVLQLILAKIAKELEYEIILPYDFSQMLALEKDVIGGKSLTFEQLLFQAIMSSGVSYSPAYTFPKSVDTKISMVMKDREFGVEWAKRKKKIDIEDGYIAKICESKIRVGRKVICVVSVENMLGIKMALEDKLSIQELSLLSEAKLRELEGADACVDADIAKDGVDMELDEEGDRDRVIVDAEPYTGGIDIARHSGVIPSIDGHDNVSRQMEKALSASNMEEKITRLEDLCLAIDSKHSSSPSRRIPSYWFDAANLVKRKRHYLQLEDNVDISSIYELSRTIYLNFISIFSSISSRAGTLVLSEVSDKSIGAISEETASMQNVVVHSDFFKEVGRVFVGVQLEEYVNKFIEVLRENKVKKLVIDFSTTSELTDLEVFIASLMIRKVTLSDDLSLETIGAEKLEINIPRAISVFIDVDKIAKWLVTARLDDTHPLFLLKPIEFLFLLKEVAFTSTELMIGLECVKARVKALKDDLYERRLSFRKGFPTLIKESIERLSDNSEAQNYIFELLRMKLRILDSGAIEVEESNVGSDILHNSYLSHCYSKRTNSFYSSISTYHTCSSNLLKLH